MSTMSRPVQSSERGSSVGAESDAPESAPSGASSFGGARTRASQTARPSSGACSTRICVRCRTRRGGGPPSARKAAPARRGRARGARRWRERASFRRFVGEGRERASAEAEREGEEREVESGVEPRQDAIVGEPRAGARARLRAPRRGAVGLALRARTKGPSHQATAPVAPRGARRRRRGGRGSKKCRPFEMPHPVSASGEPRPDRRRLVAALRGARIAIATNDAGHAHRARSGGRRASSRALPGAGELRVKEDGDGDVLDEKKKEPGRENDPGLRPRRCRKNRGGALLDDGSCDLAAHPASSRAAIAAASRRTAIRSARCSSAVSSGSAVKIARASPSIRASQAGGDVGSR